MKSVYPTLTYIENTNAVIKLNKTNNDKQTLQNMIDESVEQALIDNADKYYHQHNPPDDYSHSCNPPPVNPCCLASHAYSCNGISPQAPSYIRQTGEEVIEAPIKERGGHSLGSQTSIIIRTKLAEAKAKAKAKAEAEAKAKAKANQIIMSLANPKLE
jgi:hypothetical protein